MSQELFYTSAPRGLQPGSQGFCTVAATRGMSRALMEKLEALSGYRPMYPPSDAQYSLNPVTFAHVKIGVAGKSYHVLSRIGAAGLDYTERANKFAHHVVLEGGELPEAGPAWVLSQPGFMESRWNGEVQFLASGRIPPAGNANAEMCRAWREITGDPGWAGVIAETLLRESQQPVYLLFEPGMNLLPLVAEAVALLPPEKRWDVTFSTYFTGVPQGTMCTWRSVPRESPEAKAARKSPNCVIIDLGEPLGPARNGQLVANARGQTASLPVSANTAGLPGEGYRDEFAAAEAGERLATHVDSKRPTSPAPQAGNFPAEVPELSFPPPLPVYTAPVTPKNRRFLVASVGIGMISGAAITLGIVGIALIIWGPEHFAFSKKANEETTNRDFRSKDESDNDRKVMQELQAQIKKTKMELGEKQWQLEEASHGLTISNGKLTKEIDKNAGLTKSVKDLTKEKNDLNNQLADLRKKHPQVFEQFGEVSKVPLVSYKFHLPSKKDHFYIKELGVEEARREMSLLGLREKEGDFEVEQKAENDELNVFIKYKKNEPVLLARFWLTGAKLNFEWKLEIPKEDKKDSIPGKDVILARRKIRYSILQIKSKSTENDLHIGLIRNQKTTDPLEFRFSKSSIASRPLPFDKGETFPLENLFLGEAKCELKSSPAAIGKKDQNILFDYKDQIELRVKKDGDEFYLEAQWKGKTEPAPILYVKEYVVYMKIQNLNVEVLRRESPEKRVPNN